MKTKAAFLPTPGDPFLIKFWMDSFERVWGHEVDCLYVDINVPEWFPDHIAHLCYEIIRPGRQANRRAQVSRMTTHGDSIGRMLRACQEDMVMLCEDDAPVLKSGFVESSFRRIAGSGDCDILGSPRVSCSQAICNATAAKYDLSGQPLHDQGPNFWPCFFFSPRKVLEMTDGNFNAKTWMPGEKIEQLGLVANEVLTGDTFVWTSIQMRAMALRVGYVPQFHSYPFDMESRRDRTGLWSPECTHLHIGSLSGLVGSVADRYMFADPLVFEKHLREMRPLIESNSSLAQEMTRRYAWISVIHSRTVDRLRESLGVGAEVYATNMSRAPGLLGLAREEVNALRDVYQELITW